MDGTRSDWPALIRDALRIVVTGAVLGAAFNYMALSSRPPHGLSWIGAPSRLESVNQGAERTAPEDESDSVSGGPAVPRIGEAGSADPAPHRGHDTATGSPQASSNPAGLPVAPEPERPLRIEMPLVAQLVETGAALVVDARDAEEYVEGHIPGAINLAYEDAVREPAALERLDSAGRPIIVYCNGGTCEASRMLAEMLVRETKQRNVLVYEGGFPEWESAGKPVTRGPP